MVVPFILAGLGAVSGYRAGLVITDEDYPGDAVPDGVREKLIKGHVEQHGWNCPRCSLRRFDLQIDHKIPLAVGGRNSKNNLQILCAECNQRKGMTYTVWESLTGRWA
jgi:5-methylcytosine-specific restriction endonuclease McrA